MRVILTAALMAAGMALGSASPASAQSTVQTETRLMGQCMRTSRGNQAACRCVVNSLRAQSPPGQYETFLGIATLGANQPSYNGNVPVPQKMQEDLGLTPQKMATVRPQVSRIMNNAATQCNPASTARSTPNDPRRSQRRLRR